MGNDQRTSGTTLLAALALTAVAAIVLFGEASVAAGEGPSTSAPLDGAKVYAWSCGSCHSERWPRERTDDEWETITTHMRVRANLTAEQAEAVLRYLQGNN